MDRAARAQLLKGREVRRGLLVSNRVEVRSVDGELRFHGLASSTSIRTGNLGDESTTLVRDNGYDMGWYTERVLQGAFSKTLREKPDVQFLLNHEGLPLARTLNSSLDLRETDDGLEYDARADAEDPDAQRAARKIDQGLLDQCSFAFRVTRQKWSEDYDQRDIQEVDLHRGDVSVVNFGANPRTSVVMRSLFSDLDQLDASELGEMRSDPAVMRAVRQLIDVPAIESLTQALSELRAGATFSSATEATLKHVLSLCAASDQAMDTAQQVLADLLGVQNPDVAQDAGTQTNGLSLDLARARAYALRRTPRRSA